jgi:glycosyltransferase involved in cell wall biosynthesis
MRNLLVIVPAYNEADNLQRVIDELLEFGFDYLIINDGSIDETEHICKEYGYNNITFPINLGLSAAFQAGMKYADRNGYEMAIQYDGDGQHDPRYIENMVETMKSFNADIVIGSRFIEGNRKVSVRNLGNMLLGWLIFFVTRRRIIDSTSGMRLYSRRMIECLSRECNFPPEPDTIAYFLKNGYNVKEVPVKIRERIAGDSYLNIGNAIRYMVDMIVSIVFIQNFRKR